jgi:hypothetical protein
MRKARAQLACIVVVSNVDGNHPSPSLPSHLIISVLVYAWSGSMRPLLTAQGPSSMVNDSPQKLI